VTAGLFGLLMSVNLATPLYAIYGQRFGFSSAVLALIFATYALVLIPSLLAFGQLSDRLGRCPVIIVGLGIGIVALVLFAVANGTPWLFGARATQGLAVGTISGAATAGLVELEPHADARNAALLATFAMAGGSAGGPLFGGMLEQWAPAPRVLPYVVGMVAIGALAIAVLAVPEPNRERRSGHGLRIQRPKVPQDIRGPFVRVALTAAAVWSVAALFLSVIPSYAGEIIGTKNLALLGAIAALMLVFSCVAQVAVRRGAPPVLAQAGGLLLLALGLLGLVLASPLGTAWLLVAAAVIAGTGHGLGFLATQDDLNRIAPPEHRAEINAAFYTCIYTGVALPVIGVGVLASITSLYTGVAVFAAVTGGVALVVAAWHLAAGRQVRAGGGAVPLRRRAREPGRAFR
jgi:predicted MFS family arabinose efflux permease